MTPEALLAHADRGALWPAHAGWPRDLDEGYRAALAVCALRIARGERPAGFKIGFTNRTIWERYRVFAPIWGSVWDSTLLQAPEGRASVALAGLCQPRLEPELVFGLRAPPPAAPPLEQVFDCIDWLATGFEIVQTHCADWKFTAAETVADSGLHARLVVGPRLPREAFAADAATLKAPGGGRRAPVVRRPARRSGVRRERARRPAARAAPLRARTAALSRRARAAGRRRGHDRHLDRRLAARARPDLARRVRCAARADRARTDLALTSP